MKRKERAVEEKKVELSELTPEVQALIADKVNAMRKDMEAQMQKRVLKQSPWIKRAWRELFLPPSKSVDLQAVKANHDILRYGARCLMAIPEAGFKTRKQIKETDAEIQTRADVFITSILNRELLMAAAEYVIVRHGLVTEYNSMCEKLGSEIQGTYPMPSAEDLEKIKRMLVQQHTEGGQDGVIPEVGKGSEREVDSAGVRGDQSEPPVS